MSELLLTAFIQWWKYTDHSTNNMKNILCLGNLISDQDKLASDFTIVISIWEYEQQYVLIWTKWLRSQINTCLAESSRHLSDNLGTYKNLQQIKKEGSLKIKAFKRLVLQNRCTIVLGKISGTLTSSFRTQLWELTLPFSLHLFLAYVMAASCPATDSTGTPTLPPHRGQDSVLSSHIWARSNAPLGNSLSCFKAALSEEIY